MAVPHEVKDFQLWISTAPRHQHAELHFAERSQAEKCCTEFGPNDANWANRRAAIVTADICLNYAPSLGS